MATKQVSKTIRDVRLGDIIQLRIQPDSDGTGVDLVAIYDVYEDGVDGARYKTEHDFKMDLSSAARTALVNFVNTNVLPGINAKEGIA